MIAPDPATTLSLGAAFVAGVAASGHCIAMCGGISGALAMRRPQAAFATKIAYALAYNLSRIASYAVAGALAGLLGRTLLRAVDVAPLSVGFRVVAGLIMLAAAARLLFGWRLLDPLESAGAGLWRRIAPWAGRQGRSGGLGGAVGLGLAWGWLPCGMTYSMLLLAATTASVGGGAAVMLAFGLGTLPSMVTATVAFERIARALSSRATLRNVAGVMLLLFGLYTAGSAIASLGKAGGHGDHAQHLQHTMEQPGAAPSQPDHEHMNH